MKRTQLKRGKRLRPVSDRRRAELPRWWAVRDEVLREANGVCKRCGTKESHWSCLHPHHLLPRSLGGKDEKQNVRALCWTCHGAIHDKARSCPDWREWLKGNHR